MYLYLFSFFILFFSTGCLFKHPTPSLVSQNILKEELAQNNSQHSNTKIPKQNKEEEKKILHNNNTLTEKQKDRQNIIEQTKPKKKLKIEIIDQATFQKQQEEEAIENQRLQEELLALKEAKKNKILQETSIANDKKEIARELQREKEVFELEQKRLIEEEKRKQIAYVKAEEKRLRQLHEEAKKLLEAKKIPLKQTIAENSQKEHTPSQRVDRKQKEKKIKEKKEIQTVTKSFKEPLKHQKISTPKSIQHPLYSKDELDEIKEEKEMKKLTQSFKEPLKHPTTSTPKSIQKPLYSKEELDEIEEEKEMKKLRQQIKVGKDFTANRDTFLPPKNFKLIEIDEDSPAFGTSEIHGKIHRKKGVSSTKVYIVPKGSIKPPHYSYLNATYLNRDNRFSFYGLSPEKYDIIVESYDSMQSKKIYMKQEVNCQKKRNIHIQFHP